MYIQTFSIVAGNEACNARCPFCVASMTPEMGYSNESPTVNWRNFDIAAKYAKQSGATTAMLTGKGEPTLFPNQVTEYLSQLKQYDFPFIELQTNALNFEKEKFQDYLSTWYKLGLTTIAISTVDVEAEKNQRIYTPNRDYMDLEKVVDNLHDHGYSVRLAMVMTKDNVDSVEDIDRVIAYAKKHNIAQLTVRPVEKPEKTRNDSVTTWVSEHYISKETVDEVRQHLDAKGTRLRELVHGGIVYDVNGQNICLTNCLTHDASEDKMRQLIFFPDGKISYDWQFEGARLL